MRSLREEDVQAAKRHPGARQRPGKAGVGACSLRVLRSGGGIRDPGPARRLAGRPRARAGRREAAGAARRAAPSRGRDDADGEARRRALGRAAAGDGGQGAAGLRLAAAQDARRRRARDAAARLRPPGRGRRARPAAVRAPARATAGGCSPTAPPRRRARCSAQALALWRGPPLADFRYEAFARNEIGRLEELRLVALEQRLEADLAARPPRRGRARARDARPRASPAREPARAADAARSTAPAARPTRSRSTRTRARRSSTSSASTRARRCSSSSRRSSARTPRSTWPPPSPRFPPAAAAVSRQPAPAPACRTCGTHNGRDARYCRSCGMPLAAEASTETRKTVTVLFCDVVAFTRAGRAARPRVAAARDVALLRARGGSDRAPRRHGREVHRRRGDGGLRRPGRARGRRAARRSRGRWSCGSAWRRSRSSSARAPGSRSGSGSTPARSSPAIRPAATASSPATRSRSASGSEQRAAARRDRCSARRRTRSSRTRSRPRRSSRSSLKGKRDEVTAFRLESVDADATALPRRDDAPLVGRERELERLRDLYAEVAGGRRRPARHDRRRARDRQVAARARVPRRSSATGATVLVGRCPPYGEGITFWPLRELLRQAGRGEDELGGQQPRGLRRGDAASSRSSPPSGRVVAVFDDVHWAEPTFLDLVEYLAAPARRRARAPALPRAARARRRSGRPGCSEPADCARARAALRGRLGDAARGARSAGRRAPADRRGGRGKPALRRAARGDRRRARRDAARCPARSAASSTSASTGSSREERSRARARGRRRPQLLARERARPDASRRSASASRRSLLALVRKGLVRPDTTAPERRVPLPPRTHPRRRLRRHPEGDARRPPRARGDAARGSRPPRTRSSATTSSSAFGFRRELGRTDAELGARAGTPAPRGRTGGVRPQRPARDDLAPRTRAGAAAGRRRGAAGAADRAGLRADQGRRLRRRRDRSRRGDRGGRGGSGDRAAELHALVERQFAHSFVAAGDSADENVRLALEVMPELERLGDELGLARAWWLKSEGDAIACRWRERSEALEQALEHARRSKAGLDVVGTALGPPRAVPRLRPDTGHRSDRTSRGAARSERAPTERFARA